MAKGEPVAPFEGRGASTGSGQGAGRGGPHPLYTALTAGVAYRPCPSLLIRPELRYDYNEQSRPFQGEKGVFTAALDVVVRW